MTKKIAVIIGAGPAGLTAAYELLEKTDIQPLIFEMSEDIGGISKTVTYKGNRMDIGGHRFFTKSDRVMRWWLNILPLQGKPSSDDRILHREVLVSEEGGAPDPEQTNIVMLVRRRLSRMLFLRTFFDYPISLRWHTFKILGLMRIIRIGMSYAVSKSFPIRNEKSLKDFFINRFGKELYLTFFKDYTEKVWGVPCESIKSEWGAQRIKGLTVRKTLIHAVKNIFGKDSTVEQEKSETSLIEQFLYPKLGAGQLWEEVAKRVAEKGGEIHLNSNVVGIEVSEGLVSEVRVQNTKTNTITDYTCDFAFSTMPVKELIQTMFPAPPDKVKKVADGLVYRDFMTVGVLLRKMKIVNETTIPTMNNIVPDTWIYIQERDIKIGRIQIFNNWSPYMVENPDTVWIGLEYFCTEGDALWNQTDAELSSFAINELAELDIIEKEDVLDSTIVRMKKAYPAYFGTYDDFHIIRGYTDTIENLFLIGRNGMHKYNNTDHSMLTAMIAVENIMNGTTAKENIWQADR
ncbi:MAG: NAD(P)/FAD-dependent oxidoreductase [Proteobacteria bacterium]|nr:NAD(P)/FAD-dependent oxidoreductase [Pseudomonadota bacterium]MBU1233656.1 NAD(P)/FAD-dependent oxidoreductase [Pseudomonadota bacterium]MBU1418567.1 NAD(P)/FAD-dependent oxidoreductase [Pseudomonadota bacterium]MBU1453955.1 NAD(P)/FAD-dependent oxidoreductase [Pseudomonadota bacterium]